ncbi:MAG: efflux RND transporter periplasmic adaptor subunit [Candidatus Hydrogenedentes bacterium]|nr:efflux RND transporter periplasmic adaptor subunit [Candidatus Hydrogenedentota bacterium]
MGTSWKRVVGLLAVIAAAAGGYGAYRALGARPMTGADASTVDTAGSLRKVPVVLSRATVRGFEERRTAQGTLEAKQFAMVAARVPGTLEALFVDEGDVVVAGETELFQVDSVTLRKAVEVSRQELAVARCASREKEANLERVQADFEKAQLDYERFQRLFENKVISEDALEQQESRFKQMRALLKHARSLVDLGAEQERQAEAALAIAEKNLSDSLVYAPIDGVVSARFHEVGETAEVGKPLIRIEDPSVIEVSAYLPAAFYARVVPGQTVMRVHVYGIDVGEHAVTYKSPSIQPKLRTFEVKCLLTAPPEGVVPGAMAEIDVLFDRRTALGVPAEAIQQRGGRDVVFVTDSGFAKQVEVDTGLSSDGWVEVRGSALAEGASVVSMGQYLLDDGMPVSVREEGA